MFGLFYFRDFFIVYVIDVRDYEYSRYYNYGVFNEGGLQSNSGAVGGECYPWRATEGDYSTAAHSTGVFPTPRCQVYVQGDYNTLY